MISVEKTQNFLIPNDAVEEIMVRLPVRSLMRFQTVSKHWRSLIRSKFFGERHMALEKSKDRCKLLFVCNDGAVDTHFLKTMDLETTSTSVAEETAFEFEGLDRSLHVSESCDGLVCFYDFTSAVEVLNPATGTYIVLPLSRLQRLWIQLMEKEPVQDPNHVPEPILFSLSSLGFGKDSVNGRYILVWLYNNGPSTTTTCEVLDLEEKKWRFVNTRTLDRHSILLCNQKLAFANGSLYWLTENNLGDPTMNIKLIVFDIHTELFQVIPTPPFITRDASSADIGLCNLHGRLCISELKRDCCKQEFWWRVKNNTWEKIFSVDLRSTSTWFRGITWEPLTPLGISRDTNKVILSLRYQHNLVAFDLDPHSTNYHLYGSCYYGLVVPYFPTLSFFNSIEN